MCALWPWSHQLLQSSHQPILIPQRRSLLSQLMVVLHMAAKIFKMPSIERWVLSQQRYQPQQVSTAPGPQAPVLCSKAKTVLRHLPVPLKKFMFSVGKFVVLRKCKTVTYTVCLWMNVWDWRVGRMIRLIASYITG